MATSLEYMGFVCEQMLGLGDVRYRKMFGEYMVYLNDKPILLICNNTAFIKMRDEIAEHMQEAQTGIPYKGAKEHYIIDVEDKEMLATIMGILEKITPVPKPRKKPEKADTN